jgi:hypothetical protein
MKRAETAFDSANNRFAEPEQTLGVAREERARARQERYATGGMSTRWSLCALAAWTRWLSQTR